MQIHHTIVTKQCFAGSPRGQEIHQANINNYTEIRSQSNETNKTKFVLAKVMQKIKRINLNGSWKGASKHKQIIKTESPQMMKQRKAPLGLVRRGPWPKSTSHFKDI